jgi:hypothetical protein
VRRCRQELAATGERGGLGKRTRCQAERASPRSGSSWRARRPGRVDMAAPVSACAVSGERTWRRGRARRHGRERMAAPARAGGGWHASAAPAGERGGVNERTRRQGHGCSGECTQGLRRAHAAARTSAHGCSSGRARRRRTSAAAPVGNSDGRHASTRRGRGSMTSPCGAMVGPT